MDDAKIAKTFTIPTFEEFIDMSRKRFPTKSKKDIIQVLEKNIIRYEKKFKMSTEEFIKRYDKGEFEDREDYPGHELFRWRSDYRSLLRLKSKDENQ